MGGLLLQYLSHLSSIRRRSPAVNSPTYHFGLKSRNRRGENNSSSGQRSLQSSYKTPHITSKLCGGKSVNQHIICSQ